MGYRGLVCFSEGSSSDSINPLEHPFNKSHRVAPCDFLFKPTGRKRLSIPQQLMAAIRNRASARLHEAAQDDPIDNKKDESDERQTSYDRERQGMPTQHDIVHELDTVCSWQDV
jgi:hypothetical protein